MNGHELGEVNGVGDDTEEIEGVILRPFQWPRMLIYSQSVFAVCVCLNAMFTYSSVNIN